MLVIAFRPRGGSWASTPLAGRSHIKHFTFYLVLLGLLFGLLCYNYYYFLVSIAGILV